MEENSQSPLLIRDLKKEKKKLERESYFNIFGNIFWGATTKIKTHTTSPHKPDEFEVPTLIWIHKHISIGNLKCWLPEINPNSW